MYLNIYAFLLLLAGGGIVCFSIFYHSTILLIIEISLTAICIKGAFAIFSSWDDKKRKYTVLMQRNSPLLRPDTFKEFMSAPCGRLLARIVLKDLNQKNQYKLLKQYKPSLATQISNCRKTQTTKIIIYKQQ